MTSEITIIDGGMGKELRRIGAPFRQPEWSALALMEDPEYVRRAHQNFVDAGAELIITNTYALVPYHIGEEQFAVRAAELARLAATIAREVADAADRPVRVAGSLPPLFGSYEPWNFDAERAPELWQVLIEAQAGLVDVWLAETISSVAEFQTIASLVADRSEPFWASFTLRDDVPADAGADWAALRSGEPIDDVAHAARGLASSVLFNCSQPERFEAAIRQLVDALDDPAIAVGAYANAFEEKEEGYASNGVVLDHRHDLTPEVYAEMVQQWVNAGATIVGGCCGIRPDHIQALASISH